MLTTRQTLITSRHSESQQGLASQPTDRTRQSLLDYLRYHGVPCRLTSVGTFRVASQVSGGRGFSWRVVELQPTYRAVRAFLGY